MQLRHMGFEDAARGLLNDQELDVRERAKTVVDQFNNLLGDGHGHARGYSGGGNQGAQGGAGGNAGVGSGQGQFGGAAGSGEGMSGLGLGRFQWRHESRG